MPAAMNRDEAYAFLDSRPGWMQLSTVGGDGYPHTVPVGFFRLGDDLYTGGREGTQRWKNIARNPRVGALFESGSGKQDIKGLLVQGDAEFVTEPSDVLPLVRESARRRGTPEDELPDEPRPGAAYIRIRPRFISWDYSREQ